MSVSGPAAWLVTDGVDVLLSLTRTKRVGYLRDIRRLTVAISRARLGLYVLGRRDVFESCFELKEAFAQLFQRPDKLLLTTGEMFPCARQLVEEAESTEMDGVEHLGKYVYEMTQARVASLRAPAGASNGAALPSDTVHDEEQGGDDEPEAE